MKSLAIWATAVVAAFAALAGATSTTRDTERVFVVVDTSQGMDGVLRRVPAELDRIDDRKYAQFALATASRRSEAIHGYQDSIDWVRVKEAFDVCSFDEIDDFPESVTADERILITSSKSCSTSELDGWTVIELDR